MAHLLPWSAPGIRRSARPDRRMTSAQERGGLGAATSYLSLSSAPSRWSRTRQIDWADEALDRPRMRVISPGHRPEVPLEARLIVRRRSLQAIVQRSRGHLWAMVHDRQTSRQISGGRPHTPVGSGVGHDDRGGLPGGSERDDGRGPLPHRDVDVHAVRIHRHLMDHYPTVLIEYLTSHRPHVLTEWARTRR